MIAGLENPDSGEIVIDGKVVNDIPASKRGIGFVFQNYALFRYMTVFDNIAFGLKIQKKSKKFIKKRVNELVKLIGLEGLESVIQASFRAVKNSVLPLQERLRQTLIFFCLTNHLPQLTQRLGRSFAHGLRI